MGSEYLMLTHHMSKLSEDVVQMTRIRFHYPLQV